MTKKYFGTIDGNPLFIDSEALQDAPEVNEGEVSQEQWIASSNLLLDDIAELQSKNKKLNGLFWKAYHEAYSRNHPAAGYTEDQLRELLLDSLRN